MADVSGILLAVLAMVVLLGALIGGAATLLVGQRHVRRLEARVKEASAATDRESAARLAVSQQTLERERQVNQDLIASLRVKEREAVARHDALQVHARTQARRIETLQSEQLASEERQVRLDRAVHAQREELGWTVRDRSADPSVPERDDSAAADPDDARAQTDAAAHRDDPPTLQRGGAAELSDPARASMGARSRLASGRLARGTGGSLPSIPPLDDSEFPALSEADLPDSVEGLELDETGSSSA